MSLVDLLAGALAVGALGGSVALSAIYVRSTIPSCADQMGAGMFYGAWWSVCSLAGAAAIMLLAGLAWYWGVALVFGLYGLGAANQAWPLTWLAGALRARLGDPCADRGPPGL